ncbi:hypothetical protein Tco_0078674 [Tanacetum coccineum]
MVQKKDATIGMAMGFHQNIGGEWDFLVFQLLMEVNSVATKPGNSLVICSGSGVFKNSICIRAAFRRSCANILKDDWKLWISSRECKMSYGRLKLMERFRSDDRFIFIGVLSPSYSGSLLTSFGWHIVPLSNAARPDAVPPPPTVCCCAECPAPAFITDILLHCAPQP